MKQLISQFFSCDYLIYDTDINKFKFKEDIDPTQIKFRMISLDYGKLIGILTNTDVTGSPSKWGSYHRFTTSFLLAGYTYQPIMSVHHYSGEWVHWSQMDVNFLYKLYLKNKKLDESEIKYNKKVRAITEWFTELGAIKRPTPFLKDLIHHEAERAWGMEEGSIIMDLLTDETRKLVKLATTVSSTDEAMDNKTPQNFIPHQLLAFATGLSDSGDPCVFASLNYDIIVIIGNYLNMKYKQPVKDPKVGGAKSKRTKRKRKKTKRTKRTKRPDRPERPERPDRPDRPKITKGPKRPKRPKRTKRPKRKHRSSIKHQVAGGLDDIGEAMRDYWQSAAVEASIRYDLPEEDLAAPKKLVNDVLNKYEGKKLRITAETISRASVFSNHLVWLIQEYAKLQERDWRQHLIPEADRKPNPTLDTISAIKLAPPSSIVDGQAYWDIYREDMRSDSRMHNTRGLHRCATRDPSDLGTTEKIGAMIPLSVHGIKDDEPYELGLWMNSRDLELLDVESDDREECSICLQEIYPGWIESKKPIPPLPEKNSLRSFQCGHTFHEACVGTWLAEERHSHTKTCPLCRGKITANNWKIWPPLWAQHEDLLDPPAASGETTPGSFYVNLRTGETVSTATAACDLWRGERGLSAGR